MTNLRIIKVAGSSAFRSNYPENVLDTNNDTFFISQGADAHLDVELDEVQKFDTVAVAFSEGKTRKTKFSIAVTSDFSKFESVGNFISSGTTEAPEEYSFKPVNGKGVRLQFQGNINNIGAGNLNEPADGTTSAQSAQIAISQLAADNYNAMNIATNQQAPGINSGVVNQVSADNAAAGNISVNSSILATMNVEEQNRPPTNADVAVSDAGQNAVRQSADLSKQFFSISRVSILNKGLKPQELVNRQSGLGETLTDEKTRKQAAQGNTKQGSVASDVDHNISQNRNINVETGGQVQGLNNSQQSQSKRHGDVCSVCGNAVDETAICKQCGNNTIINDSTSVPQGSKPNNKSDRNKQQKAGTNNKSDKQDNKQSKSSSNKNSRRNDDVKFDKNDDTKSSSDSSNNNKENDNTSSNQDNKQNVKIEGQLENTDNGNKDAADNANSKNQYDIDTTSSDTPQ